MTDSTLTLLFTQRIGAFDRIISLLRRRGYPIDGMTLERTHHPDVGRMTVVVQGAAVLEQMTRHLRKLPDVLEVRGVSDDLVQREFALIRITCTGDQRAAVLAQLSEFDARAISQTDKTLVIEVAGMGTTINELLIRLEPYGIEEVARTNPIALCGASTEIRQPQRQ